LVKKAAHNIGLAKGGLTCFEKTFVQGSAFVLRMNFSTKNPALRKPQTVSGQAIATKTNKTIIKSGTLKTDQSRQLNTKQNDEQI